MSARGTGRGWVGSSDSYHITSLPVLAFPNLPTEAVINKPGHAYNHSLIQSSLLVQKTPGPVCWRSQQRHTSNTLALNLVGVCGTELVLTCAPASFPPWPFPGAWQHRAPLRVPRRHPAPESGCQWAFPLSDFRHCAPLCLTGCVFPLQAQGSLL